MTHTPSPFAYRRGCRCFGCRLASYEQRTGQWKAERFVPAWPAIAKLERLRDAGFSAPEIADALDCSASRIAQLLRHSHPQVRVSLAEAIDQLAVTDIPKHQRPAVGYSRRLRALWLAGWPVRRIAEASGLTPQSLHPLAHGLISEVRDKRAVVLDRVLAEFEAATPPTGPAANLAARCARRAGCVPLAAWDDLNDPTERPKGTPRNRRRAA